MHRLGTAPDNYQPSIEHVYTNECFANYNYNELDPNPKYQMHSDKFLVPILLWGPNNQIRGFAETIFLAIKLNRTILIPPFFRHTSDEQNDEHSTVLQPELVVDIQALSKFISIAPYSAAHETCENKIDTILLSRKCNTGPQYERLKEFETYSKLNFLRQYDSNEFIKRFVVTEDDPVADFFQNDDSNQVTVLPSDRSKLQKFIAMHLPHNNTELHQIYETESSKCAAWVFPYRAFDFRAVGLSKKDPRHLTMAFENKRFKDGIQVPAQDFDIMREIYRVVKRPKPVRDLADQFIREFIPSERYMAVHWRFEGNQVEGGKTQSICKTKANVRCDKIKNLYSNPDLIVRKIKRQMYLWDMKNVYIASPPAEGGFLSILKEKFVPYGIKVFIGSDLAKNLDDCYLMDSQVFSSIEQEICSKSVGFLYSPGSSWSLNTAIERNVRNQTMSENLESILDFGKTNVNFKPDSRTDID